jgi:hypothetical protein
MGWRAHLPQASWVHRLGPRKNGHGVPYTMALDVGREREANAELALFRRDPARYLTKAQAAVKLQQEIVRIDVATVARFLAPWPSRPQRPGCEARRHRRSSPGGRRRSRHPFLPAHAKDPEDQIRVKMQSGLLTLTSRGYLGVLASRVACRAHSLTMASPMAGLNSWLVG